MRRQLNNFSKITEVAAKSYLRPAFSKIKALFHSPLRCLMLFTALLTLGLIVYFTSYEFDRQKLLLPVSYSDGQLTVKMSAASDSGYLQGFIQACDNITAIDNIPITQLVGSIGSSDTEKITFVDTLDNTYDFSITTPLKNGQIVQLWSVQANRLTLDISKCNSTTRLSAILTAQSSCPDCLDTLPGVTQGNNFPSQIKLNLPEIKSNSGEYLSIAIVTLIVFAEIIMGCFLFVLQPARLITIVFSLCFDCIGLGVVLHYSVNYHLSILERVLGVFTFQFIPLLFFHFVLLFPDGKRLTKRAKITLTYGYLITF